MLKERFAPITPSLAKKLNSINPAAYKLWVWLRQEHRPEVSFHFNVNEAAEVIGCTTRWIRISLQRLSSIGLIKEIERWGRAMYQLILFQPAPSEEPGFEKRNKRSVSDHKRSVFSSSNPDSAVPYQRNFSEKEQSVLEQGEIWYEEGISPLPEREPEQPLKNAHTLQNPQDLLLTEVLEVAPGFNPKVFIDALARFGEVQIRKAISAVREQLERGNVKKSPEALLNTAIFKGFTSNQSKAIRRAEGFQPRGICEPVVISSGEPENQRANNEPVSPSWQIFQPNREDQQRMQTWAEQQEASLRASFVAVSTPIPISEDYSGILAQISIATMLLQWDRQRVHETLQQRYGVNQQACLSPEQLKNWLDHLRSIPLE